MKRLLVLLLCISPCVIFADDTPLAKAFSKCANFAPEFYDPGHNHPNWRTTFSALDQTDAHFEMAGEYEHRIVPNLYLAVDSSGQDPRSNIAFQKCDVFLGRDAETAPEFRGLMTTKRDQFLSAGYMPDDTLKPTDNSIVLTHCANSLAQVATFTFFDPISSFRGLQFQNIRILFENGCP